MAPVDAEKVPARHASHALSSGRAAPPGWHTSQAVAALEILHEHHPVSCTVPLMRAYLKRRCEEGA